MSVDTLPLMQPRFLDVASLDCRYPNADSRVLRKSNIRLICIL